MTGHATDTRTRRYLQTLAMKLADTQAIAVLTGRPASTIRWWAHKGWLTRRGTDEQGRALYDPEEAARVARLHPLDNGADVRQHQNDSTGSMPAAERW
jgi:MerR HTH family regulatory protein